jgi:glycosyltransferase involved in cell wall biosynthesis
VHSGKGNTVIRIKEETDQIYQFLLENKYDIVHIHYTTPLRSTYLKAAKRAGVTTRIYHSHSAYVLGKSSIKLAIYWLRKKQITKWATDYFSCSEAAARWMFEPKLLNTNKVKMIHNGINVDKFSFDKEKRNAIRNGLNIQDKFVITHTGRFTEQKNQMFLVNLLEKIKAKDSNVILLLLGDGPLLKDVYSKVKQKGLDNSVIFLGVRSDVNDYLSAADCYIMPSLYEGLPVSAIEAQCAGLPCIFSTNITKEVALESSVTFLSLDQDIESWVEAVLANKGKERNDGARIVKIRGYDVQDVAEWLQHFYIKQLKGKGND